MGAPRVLIVGTSTRAFAESASRAGHACVSVDAFGDLDQKARVENVGLGRDLGRAYSAAAAVAVSRRCDAERVAYVGNLENHPSAVRRLAAGRVLLGNPPATLTRARDHAALARVVEAAGARVPRTLRADAARSSPLAGAWLKKPERGGGGGGVAAWAPSTRVRASDLVQERIDGVLGSVSFVADGRHAVLLGVAQGLAGDPAFGARGYRYCGSLYPLAGAERLLERLDAVAQTATRAFGLMGVNGLDFVVRDALPFVLELNPRYSASMELIERTSGTSLFELHAAACGGSLPAAPSLSDDSSGGVLGKAVVWARRDVVLGDTRPWLTRDDLRDIPFPGETVRRGHPICTIFTRGEDAEACYRALVAAAANLEGQITTTAEAAHA